MVSDIGAGWEGDGVRRMPYVHRLRRGWSVWYAMRAQELSVGTGKPALLYPDTLKINVDETYNSNFGSAVVGDWELLSGIMRAMRN
jgi:hypothetical protein